MNQYQNVLLFYERRKDWLNKFGSSKNNSVLKDKSRFLQRDEEIDSVILALKERGYSITHLNKPQDLYNLILKGDDSLQKSVGWNITDGYDIYMGSHFPSFLSLLGIPYIMEESYIQALAQNKDHFKSVVKSMGILTPEWLTVTPYIRDNNINFPGPYIVKPSKLDNSIGLLSEKSNVFDQPIKALNFARLHARVYNSPMIIERFIKGFDITNPYAFFDDELHMSLFKECLDEDWANYIYQSNKLKDLRAKKMVCIEDKIIDLKVRKISKYLIKNLHLKSYGRFDFRYCTEDNLVYLFELNPGTSLTGLPFEKFYEIKGITLSEFMEKMISSKFKGQK